MRKGKLFCTLVMSVMLVFTTMPSLAFAEDQAAPADAPAVTTEEEAIDEPEDESEPPAKKSDNIVETGDNTNVVAPIAIMCIALAGIIALLISRKRRQK